ncbi:hypothetical protein [Pseudomonas sp. BN102]|uniref:hypothetical protein n=1 Tax=Pseudomonas sp. BN102 TaxID=2567886 RepID=UPI00245402C7|nr:hypothetical protein [Pseudomonas sp. BN102]MDH4607539.1 hypothetical protein [Pseudomonas sp. BN102]
MAMEDKASSETVRTYRYCSVQLNAFSLMLLTTLSGFCGGIAWALILFLVDGLGMVTLERFDNPLVNFIGFPLLAALGSALFSLVGYPLYNWVCKNLRGQRLMGIFHDPHN